LDRLAELERGWADAAAGTSLLHADLRADNILLTADRVVFVDWPHACVGAGWLDLLLMLPSVAVRGGVPVELAWRRYPPARAAPDEAVDAVLAGLAGLLVRRSLLPAPRNIPRVRDFQLAQGRATLDWLAARRRW
ncbi:MAG: phosphotransferase, partial [Sciscionella sp.]